MNNIDGLVETIKSTLNNTEKNKIEELKQNETRGRPVGSHIRVDLIGEDFLQGYTLNGERTLRYYHGDFYMYVKTRWEKVKEFEVRSILTTYLQNNESHQVKVQKSLISDIMENLKSTKLCNLSSIEYESPCWISTKKRGQNCLVTQSGILNIDERIKQGEDYKMEPLSPDFFSMCSIPYEYDPTQTCPMWEKYLEDVQPNPENREVLQMMMGLSLIPDISYNVFFLLVGEGGTGKSVFLDTLLSLVGSNNSCSIPMTNFGDRFGLSPMTEKLVNVSFELPSPQEFRTLKSLEETLKKITSGDIIQVEEKFKDPWTSKPTVRCIFGTNELPPFLDKSNGVWDRLRIVPFNQIIRGTDKEIIGLKDLLKEEMSGILNWSLEGLMKLKKLKSFPQCQEGESMKQEHRLSCDHELSFLKGSVMESKGEQLSKKELYSNYKSWCEENGFNTYGSSRFNECVKRTFKGITEKKERKHGQNTHCWVNLTYIPDDVEKVIDNSSFE